MLPRHHRTAPGGRPRSINAVFRLYDALKRDAIQRAL
ncbi:hypothetical protein OCOJLMKI_0567 [Methylobacterium iners]|uniref:Transposase n=1 Tax=Methylobacterium iners TaxID=418707 RepID=A0ABQ4RT92_9HYPH|nr:hypothetical protein OCOJLMKI_0567 [Methylobacterium iners]